MASTPPTPPDIDTSRDSCQVKWFITLDAATANLPLPFNISFSYVRFKCVLTVSGEMHIAYPMSAFESPCPTKKNASISLGVKSAKYSITSSN